MLKIKEMVEVMYEEYADLPEKEKLRFKSTLHRHLIVHQSTLGTKIQVKFNLWRNYIANQEEHPDETSMKVIEALWYIMNNVKPEAQVVV